MTTLFLHFKKKNTKRECKWIIGESKSLSDHGLRDFSGSSDLLTKKGEEKVFEAKRTPISECFLIFIKIITIVKFYESALVFVNCLKGSNRNILIIINGNTATTETLNYKLRMRLYFGIGNGELPNSESFKKA